MATENDYSEQGVQVWRDGVSSPGLSPLYAVLGPTHNAVIVEFQPVGGALSGSFQVVDSDNPNTGFHSTVDSSGATGTLSAYEKRIVAGVHRYIRVQALSVSGRWLVKVVPITATNQQTITTTVSGTVNQGTPGGSPWPVSGTVNQGTPGGSPWPVSAADGALVTEGALADAAVVTDAAGSLSAKLRGLVKLLAAAVDLTYNWLRMQPQPSSWTLYGTSAANSAQTVTQAAAGAGVRNYLSGLTVSWSGGAPAAGTKVEINDGATAIWGAFIGLNAATIGTNDYEFTAPLRSSANSALNVVVDAGGAGVISKVSAQGTVGP